MRVVAILAVLVALAAAGWYFLRHRFEPPPPPPAPPTAKVEVPQPKGPQPPQYPVPVEPPPKPLPPIGASDPSVQQALNDLLGAGAVQKFFHIEDTVRRFVATVDNLPRETVANRINPVKPIGGLVATTGREEILVIARENSARYAPFIRMAESIDTAKAVKTYVYFYPLFQQAYVELGYPNGYFNDRLVAVIDHLLATPEVKGPIRLVQPKVLHEYADPGLEKRSAGQKMLIRMGPENAAKLKAKLHEIRALLVSQVPKK